MLWQAGKWACAVVFCLTVTMAGAAVPELPPLPASGWPSSAVADPFARELIAALPVGQLEPFLAENPAAVPPVLRTLGTALMTDDETLRQQVEVYLRSLAKLRAERIQKRFSHDDVRMLVSIQLVDPMRFLQDAEFRARVLPMLPRLLTRATRPELRDACLRELTGPIGLDFDALERIALAWGSAPRDSSRRRTSAPAALRMPDDVSGPIQVSIFSLGSDFFTAAEAQTFLRAVTAAAPKRHIIVLADDEIRRALADLPVHVIDTHSRGYTPWPRDPFTIGRTADGGVVLVNRPNLQPDREDDATMVRAIIQGLPAALDDLWKETKWSTASVPFHNGHVLLTPDTVWISIHTVEIRALEILGLERVPVETFGTSRGIEVYLAAVRAAAAELESLYGRPVRFVHALEADPQLMRRLGGGGGFDLDSVLTILPQKEGPPVAFVGNVELGASLARTSDWDAARRAYGIQGDVAAAQKAPRTVALQTYLDAIAEHLASSGMKVRRLPLLNVPPTFVAGAPRDFLLSWNNVVLEENGGSYRAEGFASLLPELDTVARETFAGAGYVLDLYPPLVRSVILSGGYRCASNHLRP